MKILTKNIISVFILLFMFITPAYAVVIDGVEYWCYDIPRKYEFEECPTLEEVQNMSMFSSCGLSYEQLERGLQGELKDLAWCYFDAEGMYGVNAVLKAAQDALESDWGRVCFQPNNISGFFTDIDFSSKEECIDLTAARLQTWYLLPPEDCICSYHSGETEEYNGCTFGQFYHGSSIYEVSISYCPIDGNSVNYEYGNMVSEIAWGIYKRAFESATMQQNKNSVFEVE